MSENKPTIQRAFEAKIKGKGYVVPPPPPPPKQTLKDQTPPPKPKK